MIPVEVFVKYTVGLFLVAEGSVLYRDTAGCKIQPAGLSRR